MALVMATFMLAGCGPATTTTGGGTGSVLVFLTPEDNITTGMDPGMEAGFIHDGWQVRYQKFLMAFGNFEATRSDDPNARMSDSRVFIVDLLNTPASALVISSFDNVAAVQWDKVSYQIPNATAASLKLGGVSDADFTLMTGNGYSTYIEGTITKAGGVSCRPSAPTDCIAAEMVRFRWPLRLGQSYQDCGPEEGLAGFAVPSGGTAQLKPTLHGDHWFLSNFNHTTDLYAQWIADGDLDRDGMTTDAELSNVNASDLFPSPKYNLSGFPGTITTAKDYLDTAIRTLAHFQGEGECNTRRPL